jgi:hypothetical protein
VWNSFELGRSFGVAQDPLATGRVDTGPASTSQLAHQPHVSTRNRQPLRPNPLASYRLRVGKLRVYYDVSLTPQPLVVVKAIGVKVRERVRVGGEEIEL